MERRGYIVAGNTHRFFSQSARDALELQAKHILALIEKQQQITLPSIRFAIKIQTIGSQKPTTVVSANFPGSENGDIRVILSPSKISEDVTRRAFSKNDLFVLIEEDQGSITPSAKRGVSSTSGHIQTHPLRSGRLLQDIIIDVTIGTYFRDREPLKTLVANEGLASLYSKKVAFARARRGGATHLKVSKSASYVMLSSIVSGSDAEVDRRASDIFEVWQQFVESLSPPNPLTGASVIVRGPSGDVPLGRIRGVGRQLSLKQVRAAVSTLGAGDYILTILRRSPNIRKKPAFRNQFTHIFGPNAKLNSFRIYSINEYESNRRIIQELEKYGHISIVKIVVDKNSSSNI